MRRYKLLSRTWIEISHAISESDAKESEIESVGLDNQDIERGCLQHHGK